MPNLTLAADLDAFLATANDAAARTELGLTALATTTPAAGIATFLATPSSANLRTAMTDESGSGALLFASGALGTPLSGVLSGCTGYPTAQLTGAGTGVLTFLATPSSANLLAAVTDETGTGALVFGTSPSITTSIVSASATLAVFNATATTVNAFGAATALNIGASAATVLNFGGFTSAAELRFLEPSGSGTNYSGFKQPALGASITYLLPSDAPTDGQFLSCLANGTLSWETSAGSGDVSGPVSSTDNGIAVWNGTGGDTLEDSTITITGGDTLNATNVDATNLTVDSVVAGAATMALFNTVATTVNAFGATTTLNIGASATCILNFGGSTTASEFRYLEPSGSGTNYTAFKAQAQGASITYTLPATVGGAGTFLTDAAGNGTLSWATPGGSGTVTVVGAGSLTSTAFVTGGGTTTLQTPSTTSTLDSSGNAVFVGTASATRFIPTGSTIPTNGMYLPAANTLGWGINSAEELRLTATALSPGADDGNALGTTSLKWADVFLASGAVINFNSGNLTLTHSAGVLTSNGAYVGTVGTFSSTTSLLLGTAGSAVGNIGFRNATSGTATLTPPTGALGTYSVTLPNAASTLPIYGQQITYSGPTAARTITLPDENFSVGFRGVPQNAKTGSYTLLATDNGRVIPNTTGGWTVNNSVHTAGDVITVYNDSGSSQNITAGTITTMRLAGTASTGTRALAQRGLATLYFQTATEVIVSGAGVT